MHRVVLKVSGEALQGEHKWGIDLHRLFRFAHEIKISLQKKTNIGIVVGGGNIWRGGREKGLQLDRVISDNMGMMATLINSLALQDALEKIGVEVRVMSAIDIPRIAEPYIRRRAIRHMEKNRIVIFACGTGNPFFSTDTAAALRATEVQAQVLLKATNVDGVYNEDPKKNKNAKLFNSLPLEEAINMRLKILDSTALNICFENKLPIRVFNMNKKDNIFKAIMGEKIGTYLYV